MISLYGEETVTKMGLLPWAALDAYNQLVQSFLEKNRDKVLIFAADLGHYVADGHQPFHTMLNYDGQLTDQKGIHGRYESEMVNRYIDQISNSLTTREVKYVTEPLEYIFDFLTASNFYSPIIFTADKTAYAQSDSHGSDRLLSAYVVPNKTCYYKSIIGCFGIIGIAYLLGLGRCGKTFIRRTELKIFKHYF